MKKHKKYFASLHYDSKCQPLTFENTTHDSIGTLKNPPNSQCYTQRNTVQTTIKFIRPVLNSSMNASASCFSLYYTDKHF